MLNGKAAVVTGSTSGIGLAVARALAQAGANVTLNGFGDAAEIERLRASGDNARADAELAEYKREHRAYAGAPDR
jgi:NAD(P)-dependent dehydrogenase (short-subunit alcohol dehydrogenase family)